MNITELQDYPRIQQIQEALWQVGEIRGAAVMVGAGFSRFFKKDTPSTPLPPLWTDFMSAMKEKLYPTGNAPNDPLKLAQEYQAALGETALDGLIRSLVKDDRWMPGYTHKKLLALPWTDVLTTNWDTLLERTELPDPDRTYETVRTINDIPRTRSPRITKLHGSFPSNKPFIFTEEDYRTYPIKFAPFVNLAQQVFLENELCLLGFSGDDPNFLQWAGWVRDHLGKSARPIRLVGVLNLSQSRRQMLEQQNVMPIDLAELVKNCDPSEKHEKAIIKFLETLEEGKPVERHKWERSVLNSEEIHTAKMISTAWKKERQHYPGWIVLPAGKQERIRYETNSVTTQHGYLLDTDHYP